jgi:hypothetical protein
MYIPQNANNVCVAGKVFRLSSFGDVNTCTVHVRCKFLTHKCVTSIENVIHVMHYLLVIGTYFPPAFCGRCKLFFTHLKEVIMNCKIVEGCHVIRHL